MNRSENIDFCIRYLMEQNEATAVMPQTLHDKKQLLRSLMNVWRPQPLSIDFLKAQDEELQMQLRDKGVVRTRERLWQGDITRLKVDAIVNAAGPRGLGCWNPLHPCIDNDIHSAAGLQLRMECDKILQGDTIATGGAIYRTCLWLAQQHNCNSIAFCCISTGDFHFPNRRAAEIAINACREARIRVIFNVYKDIDYSIYKELLRLR